MKRHLKQRLATMLAKKSTTQRELVNAKRMMGARIRRPAAQWEVAA